MTSNDIRRVASVTCMILICGLMLLTGCSRTVYPAESTAASSHCFPLPGAKVISPYGQRGILAKVLGQFTPKYIIMVDGQPFSKNDKENLINGARFFSYPFPAAKDVKEALDILRSNPGLLQQFGEASMHIDILSKFWVSETASHLIIMKKPQCYDASSGSVITASDSDAPYRLTLAYFYKGDLTWQTL